MKGIEWKGFPAVALAIVLACVPSPAAASLAVALVTADRIVVASDSRTWNSACDCFAGDTARKVDVRDGVAFIMTGWPGVFPAWQHTPIWAGEPVRDLARRILDKAEPDDRQAQAFSMLIMRYGAPVDAYAAEVELHPDGRIDFLQEVTPAAPFALNLGWDDGGKEQDAILSRLYDQLREAPTEARMVEMATSLLATAARQSPKVGGPSHVAIVDQAGARWHTSPVASSDHWDGTNLTIVSNRLKIDETGVSFVNIPTSSDPSAAVSWLTGGDATGEIFATYQAGNYARLQSFMSTDDAALPIRNELRTLYTPTGHTARFTAENTGTSTTAAVYADGNITLTASGSTITLNGALVTIGAVPNFNGATSPTAGAIAGYINVQVGGVSARIPVYAP